MPVDCPWGSAAFDAASGEGVEVMDPEALKQARGLCGVAFPTAFDSSDSYVPPSDSYAHPEDYCENCEDIAAALIAARTEGEEKERDGWESGIARMALQAPPGTKWQQMNPAKLARVIADHATNVERQRCASVVYDPDDPVNNDPEWKQRSLWLYRAAQALFDVEEED